MPLISIILPTYNVEKYIARALESCINQTLKDIEIIVVDDKGQDRSIDIAYEYASRDYRVKIIDNTTNKGTYEARNIGVRNANSELIMFLDPDDELELNACEIALENMKPSIDMVCFSAFSIMNHQSSYFIKRNDKSLSNIEYMKEKSVWSICARVIKKDLFLRTIEIIGKYDRLVMAEDALISYVLANICDKILLNNISIYKYYEDIESITKSYDNEKYKAVEYSYFKVIELIDNISSINDFNKNYSEYCKNKLLAEYYSYSRRIYKKKNILKYLKLKLISIKQQKLVKKTYERLKCH
ncbi:glycosyltransferase, family 2 [Campylobacter sp. RM5004]|uniref:glycosyltransferase family 2 protein n=1 Tax=Campylobacter sp. RM5004 TaxID=1660078 RepID=UPI001EFB4F99|nr:glycosyltransferase family 2 protein [Campylobacter sp. RM5004]ULO02442.1 glycosyltransferase, family 2 [Campylobacter sp. RM5004]